MTRAERTARLSVRVRLGVLAALLPSLLQALAPLPAAAQEVPFPLEGLIVTASPNPRPAEAVAAHVSVLDGAELRRQGLLDLADALRQVAGISVVRGGSYGAATSVFMRGGESNYVQVLVDGVAVNQPGGSYDFASLTLENVERIEVVRGPASALYGSDAVAGVVHVITRTGSDRPALDVAVRAGTFGRMDGTASLTGGSARASYGLSLGRYRTDGILPMNNRHENTVLTGTVRLAPDDRTRADVLVRAAERRYHFPTDGAGAVVDTNAFSYGDETTVAVSGRRQLSPRWTLAARLSAHELDGGTDDQPDGPADTLGFYGFTSLDHVRRVAAELTSTVHLGRVAATGGVEAEEQRQRSFTETVSEFGASSDRSEYERDNRGVFGHVVYDGATGSLNGGVRLEDNERYGRFFTWQAGAAWRATQYVRARASAGRGVKEPGFFETFATGFARGNPDLEPERSVSLEAGLDVTLPAGLTTRATVFRHRFTDLIQYTPSPPDADGPNYFNVAKAQATGLELGMTGSTGPFNASADWTWLSTEVLDGGFDEDADAEFAPGARLLRRPEHTVHVRAAYDAGDVLVLAADARFVGTRADRDFATGEPERVDLARYTTVGVSAEVRLPGGQAGLPPTALTFRAENLFDEHYQEVLGFDAPRRALVVGARVTLGGAR